jgi:hypothetical protein
VPEAWCIFTRLRLRRDDLHQCSALNRHSRLAVRLPDTATQDLQSPHDSGRHTPQKCTAFKALVRSYSRAASRYLSGAQHTISGCEPTSSGRSGRNSAQRDTSYACSASAPLSDPDCWPADDASSRCSQVNNSGPCADCRPQIEKRVQVSLRSTAMKPAAGRARRCYLLERPAYRSNPWRWSEEQGLMLSGEPALAQPL